MDEMLLFGIRNTAFHEREALRSHGVCKNGRFLLSGETLFAAWAFARLHWLDERLFPPLGSRNGEALAFATISFSDEMLFTALAFATVTFSDEKLLTAMAYAAVCFLDAKLFTELAFCNGELFG